MLRVMRSRGLLVALFVVCACLGYWYLADVNGQMMSVNFFNFQARDVDRALKLLDGNWIFFGPEMTGGGHLPGPFYYYLLAAPLSITSSWQWTWAWLLFLNFAAMAVAAVYLGRRVNPMAGLFFSLIHVGSLQIKRYQCLLLNVSFAIPIVILLVCALTESFIQANPTKRQRALIISGLLLGLGLQLHFSLIVFLAAVLLGQLFAKRWGLYQHSIRSLLFAGVALATPLLPFLLWRLFGSVWGQPEFYAGESNNALPSLLHMFDYVKDKSVLQYSEEVIKKILEATPFSLIFAAILFQGRRLLQGPFSAMRAALLLFMAVGLLPFLYWTVATIGMRYGSVFSMSLMFLSSIILANLYLDAKPLPKMSWGKWIFSALCLIALVGWAPNVLFDLNLLLSMAFVGGFLWLGSLLFMDPKYQSKRSALIILLLVATTSVQRELGASGALRADPILMTRYSQWLQIWTRIYNQTQWDYSTAMRRIYFINHHLEQDPYPVYEEVRNKNSQPSKKSVQEPDGYFVTFYKNTDGLSLRTLRQWILNQNIQSDVRRAIEANHIVLEDFVPGPVMVVPFRVVDNALLPKYFHNNGVGYLEDKRTQSILSSAPQNSAQMIQDNEFLFHWNECSDRNEYCNTGIRVQLNRRTDWQIEVESEILGLSLSQVSPWISPNWTIHWTEPYIDLTCDGKSHQFTLISSIGYNRDFASVPKRVLLWGNNSILTPFQRSFTLPCRGSMTAIKAGHRGLRVERIFSWDPMPAREQEISIQ